MSSQPPPHDPHGPPPATPHAPPAPPAQPPAGYAPPPYPAQPYGQPYAPVPMITGPICPRCGSGMTKAGSIPVWAIVLAVLLCPIGLLFLLVKDPNQCNACGMQWKA